jgi:hypothetical protein
MAIACALLYSSGVCGFGYQTPFMLDVVDELVAKILDKTLDWKGSCLAQGADGAPGDVVRHRVQQIEILRPALTVLDAVHDPV